MEDTGVEIIGANQAGRWIEDVKDGRKRNLHIYMVDHGMAGDQSYVGYFSDLNKETRGCNLALSIGQETVDLQFVPANRSKPAIIKSIETAKFMDLLDGILKMFA